eukprot:CAMPEP_0115833468 /NCGR_PEP_ID=MMETSP0287-20121206/3189_1 /TAXON_ID=412157 /ORGANISM="Chrysochromulina rotalis, Strain UIO044" /LENGTH=136 /DNA_ID=CAMNT_0003286885 /DNA_START=237 /DNA_END=643 /DNA_ORIENTATION=+
MVGDLPRRNQPDLASPSGSGMSHHCSDAARSAAPSEVISSPATILATGSSSERAVRSPTPPTGGHRVVGGCEKSPTQSEWERRPPAVGRGRSTVRNGGASGSGGGGGGGGLRNSLTSTSQAVAALRAIGRLPPAVL